ncbi:uncharacterized protein LOC112510944 [Cynara cardunculus var. scolymus]|uniref:Uncharacterized protein n=1 Tax=Cynara cardunculus var. scolymus TaxID=59895 RepID=A0A103XWI5_CYNCS|nr:uncharacterized protein LOC112510944 [Cynara cardunculus var. scolymus]KVH98181.1 hypothetical protein Ccrd_023601 [Cynara cardunculus var. scolymus]
MKKKIEQTQEQHELEIIKAVAQAWHGHSTATAAPDPTATNEFDARRLNFKNKPTRFKLEAIMKPSRNKDGSERATSWDFRQSLWDSYEIVAVSRRLENGLLLGDDFDESTQSQVGKRKKESKNSLRNVLNRTSKRLDV